MAGMEQSVGSGSGGQAHRKHRSEGPKNHLLTFAISIILTALSFVAVAYTLAAEVHVEKWFITFFIIILALFQAVVQLGFWMHMKDKGHGFPVLVMAFGFVIALTCVLGGVVWSWW